MSDVTAPIELPVIDISDPHDRAVGKAMLDAAAKYGFLYVNSKGSDFTAEDVDRAFGLVCDVLRSLHECAVTDCRYSRKSSLPLLLRRRRLVGSRRMCVAAYAYLDYHVPTNPSDRTVAGLGCIRKHSIRRISVYVKHHFIQITLS